MVYKNVNTILMGKSGQLKIKQYLGGEHNLHHHRSDFWNTYSTHPLHPSSSMHPLTSPPFSVVDFKTVWIQAKRFELQWLFPSCSTLLVT